MYQEEEGDEGEEENIRHHVRHRRVSRTTPLRAGAKQARTHAAARELLLE